MGMNNVKNDNELQAEKVKENIRAETKPSRYKIQNKKGSDRFMQSYSMFKVVIY